ncbi:MAG: hypothetical protein LC667_01980 [Thioalkalivibrio sp.]|nr:hypothetical protein [Thioalkalivibrio sp.]
MRLGVLRRVVPEVVERRLVVLPRVLRPALLEAPHQDVLVAGLSQSLRRDAQLELLAPSLFTEEVDVVEVPAYGDLGVLRPLPSRGPTFGFGIPEDDSAPTIQAEIPLVPPVRTLAGNAYGTFKACLRGSRRACPVSGHGVLSRESMCLPTPPADEVRPNQ